MTRYFALIVLLILSVALARPVSATTAASGVHPMTASLHIGLHQHTGSGTSVGRELKDAFTLLVLALAAAQVCLFAPVLTCFAARPPEKAAICRWCRFR
jgi:hypothetical protein